MVKANIYIGIYLLTAWKATNRMVVLQMVVSTKFIIITNSKPNKHFMANCWNLTDQNNAWRIVINKDKTEKERYDQVSYWRRHFYIVQKHFNLVRCILKCDQKSLVIHSLGKCSTIWFYLKSLGAFASGGFEL